MVKVKHNNLFDEIPLEQAGPYKFKLAFKPKTCGKRLKTLYLFYIHFKTLFLQAITNCTFILRVYFCQKCQFMQT